MIIDEVTLLSYVDQQLPEQHRSLVEAAIAQNAGLRDRLAALQASHLPYPTAFAAQALPAMPAGLDGRLQALLAVAASGQNAAQRRQMPSMAELSKRYWRSGLALAASFAFGWFLLQLLPVPMPAVAPPVTVQPATGLVTGAPAWVHAVANYQAMYSRTTLDQPAQSLGAAQAVLAEFQQGAQTVLVPDLRADGMEFKRAQRLTYGELPLLQMAYLPKSGKPAALCVLKRASPGADESAHVQPRFPVRTRDGRESGFESVFG